jgi:hypothetical protein
METSEIKIRKLKYKDRKTLSALIGKLADKIGTKGITDIIVSDISGVTDDEKTVPDKNAVFVKIGVELLDRAFKFLENDVREWFSDLIGIDKEKFNDDMPFDIEMIIIEQLVEAKEINSFFTHALRAFNGMKGYVRQAKTESPK